MDKKWRKAKTSLGLKLCVSAPRTSQSPPPATAAPSGRLSDASSPPSTVGRSSRRSDTPTASSSGLRLSIGGSKSFSKKTCAICLATMKEGHGHAIFTAECSHAFHFQCIASNVKHGNQICPVCRAKWKELPFQSPGPGVVLGGGTASAGDGRPAQDDPWTAVIRRLRPRAAAASSHAPPPPHHPLEPGVYDDDEVLERRPEETSAPWSHPDDAADGGLEVQTYPEVSAVPKCAVHKEFAVLVHLKAPPASRGQSGRRNGADRSSSSSAPENTRAPIDVVTVLDTSGSMAGSKLALLKRAMNFVIQSLGPSDRLSVVAFSSHARRLFPLRRMTDAGRQQALQAVNSLISSGGTNIAAGLKKGAKLMTDRRGKNPVSSIILLSDGQDTYNYNVVETDSRGGGGGAAPPRPRTDYGWLLPSSIKFQRSGGGSGFQIPVHTFGFGADNDAVSMHAMAEASGGTFSFIEAEDVIQDAFAQCIGGLLSVVVQELRVGVECVDPSLRLGSIKAGSYKTSVPGDRRSGSVDVGDLYAEEERDFLVSLDIASAEHADAAEAMSLLRVSCAYRNPVTRALATLEGVDEVKIRRPDFAGDVAPSMEVDRQRNRLRAAEVMADARAAAERGDLDRAVAALESYRGALSETASAKAGDRLCLALDAELKEMQERMANRSVYEASGRAYVLSGLSSHSWQRATARGDSTDSTSLLQSYQTPTMTTMVSHSQVFTDSLLPAGHHRQVRPPPPPRSFFTHSHPR